MNEKLLLTIPNKKIFSDNSSQTHSAEKLGKNVYAKKTRQMKWINFTVYTFQFPWSEFVSKKDILIQSSLNWFHNFFLAWTFKNFLTCCEKPTNSISESRITHNHVFAVQKADLVTTTVIVCTGILSKNSWGEIGCKYVIHCRDWPSPTT